MRKIFLRYSLENALAICPFRLKNLNALITKLNLRPTLRISFVDLHGHVTSRNLPRERKGEDPGMRLIVSMINLVLQLPGF